MWIAVLFILALQMALFANWEGHKSFNINKNQSVGLITENDSYIDILKGYTRTDKLYTAGQYLSYLSPEFENSQINEISALSRLYDTHFTRFAIAIKQEMHIPKDRDRRKFTPPKNDILFGASLYANVAFISRTPDFMEQLSLDLGVVGPYAFGKETQNGVHRLTNNPHIYGWDYAALKSEFVANLHYGLIWRLRIYDDYFDALPQFRLSLGNAFTAVATGINFRLGYGLENDFGSPKLKSRFHQNIAGNGLKIYGVFGINRNYIARDIFIEGNTGRNKSAVRAKHVVDEIELGAVIGWKNFSLGYVYVTETPRFKEQNFHHKYGSFQLEYIF